MGGGAWPFLVGGVICLVNSDNERDLSLLTSASELLPGEGLGPWQSWETGAVNSGLDP